MRKQQKSIHHKYNISSKIEIDWDYFNNVISIRDVAELLGIEIDSKNSFLCPSHDDTNPSASLSEEKNRWYCFSCGAGGTPINLVMAVNGGNTLDAVFFLDKYYPGGIKYIEQEKYDDTPFISVATLKKIGLKSNPFLEKITKDVTYIDECGDKRIAPRTIQLNPIEAADIILEKCLNYQQRLHAYQDQFISLYPGLDNNALKYIHQRTKEQADSVNSTIAIMREYILEHIDMYKDQFAWQPGLIEEDSLEEENER